MSVSDQISPNEAGMRDEIARLEVRIEGLAESIERCRKMSLFARLLLAGGAIWMLLILLRVLPFAPFHLVGAIAVLIGGTVLFGSNASTWKQMIAARAQAESQRAALIDLIAMRTVDEDDAGADVVARLGHFRPGPTIH